MTTTINMRLPYLGEISYEVRREMQRLVHRYAIMPFQFRFIHAVVGLRLGGPEARLKRGPL